MYYTYYLRMLLFSHLAGGSSIWYLYWIELRAFLIYFCHPASLIFATIFILGAFLNVNLQLYSLNTCKKGTWPVSADRSIVVLPSKSTWLMPVPSSLFLNLQKKLHVSIFDSCVVEYQEKWSLRCPLEELWLAPRCRAPMRRELKC